MTVTELNRFCESLPGMKCVRGRDKPCKSLFAVECDIKIDHLKEILEGKKRLTLATTRRILPVMRKYGFQGSL